jgi:chitodextrinase
MMCGHFFRLITVLFLVVLACGTENGIAPDDTPPAAIADLAVLSTSDVSITLGWTAPGDDGDDGTATAYDIRYGISEITNATWGVARQVNGEPVPRSGGTEESLEITIPAQSLIAQSASGADIDTTYYFAIKTVDEAGNWSVLSNVASGTLADITPPAEVADLSIAGLSDTSITLRWTAPGDDGVIGTAAAYDLRYAISPIDSGSWDDAAVVGALPDPNPAMATEMFEVTGLASGMTYFFALKTHDDQDNWSELSNVTSGTTSLSPAAGVPDRNGQKHAHGSRSQVQDNPVQ